MAVLRSVGAGLSLLLLVSCWSAPTELSLRGGDPQVHGMVMTGDTLASFFVGVGDATDHKLRPLEHVTGVLVAETTGQEYALTESGTSEPCLFGAEPEAAGCFQAVLSEPALAGRRYALALQIHAEEVTEVAGRVTAPAPIQVVGADTTLRLDCSPDRLACDGGNQIAEVGRITWDWTADGVLGWLAVRADSSEVFHEGARLEDVECFVSSPDMQQRIHPPSGRFVLRIERVACFAADDLVPFDSIHISLSLMALDTAYARYRSSFLDGDEVASKSDISAGLTGSRGYFVGAAETILDVTLERP